MPALQPTRQPSSRLLDSELPIISAPMAGGPTTPALTAAVAEAGGFPFLAGGYKTPEALASEIAQARDLGTGFGVNLFAASGEHPEVAAFRTYSAELAPEFAAYGLQTDPAIITDDDHWHDKIALLTAHPVPVVSFTFGLPNAAEVAALQRAGSIVLGTVTTPAEAVAAQEIGVDGLVVQAPAAGGHSGTFDPGRVIAPLDAAVLVSGIRAAVHLPIIAAGGVDGPAAVAALLGAGAEAVAVGTLLLRTDEAGTSATHRTALADPAFTETVITHAFTGRPARALRNGFIDRHTGTAPLGYPALHHLTRPLRQAAAKADDPERLHLWAGTGYRNAQTGPAADMIHWLANGGSA